MYQIIKEVIESKQYELGSILHKITILWVQGSLTDEEKNELILLAQNKADQSASVDILDKLKELDLRISKLEAKDNSNLEKPSTIPEYISGHWYYANDMIIFKGKTYKCIAPENVACVWNPEEYPQYWQEQKTENPTEETI